MSLRRWMMEQECETKCMTFSSSYAPSREPNLLAPVGCVSVILEKLVPVGTISEYASSYQVPLLSGDPSVSDEWYPTKDYSLP